MTSRYELSELLSWLHEQIDANDPRNPKYAALWKQIDAIRQAWLFTVECEARNKILKKIIEDDRGISADILIKRRRGGLASTLDSKA